MRPARVVIAVMAGGVLLGAVLFLGGVGMLLGWRTVSSDWNDVERTMAGLFTLAGGAMMLILTLGVARQSVAGYPRATIEPLGLRYGPAFIRWSVVRSITRLVAYGQPYLAVDVPGSAIEQCRLIDRAHGWVNTQSNLPRLMLTPQQLGMSTDEAIARIAAERGASLADDGLR